MSGLNFWRGQFWLRTFTSVLSFYLCSLTLYGVFLSLLLVSTPTFAADVSVKLIDAQSGLPLGSTEITAYTLDEDGGRDWHSRLSTDDTGQVTFALDNIENGASYILGSKVYNNYRNFSEPLTEVTHVDFIVGKVRMALTNGSEGGLPPFANQSVSIKTVNAEGKFDWYSSATTDDNGMLRLNLPDIDSGQAYVVRAKSSVNGQSKYSEVLHDEGDYAFVVGNKALAVTLTDAQSGSPIPEQKVKAYLLDDDDKKHWVTSSESDSNGMALFDLEGLGVGARYVLGAKVYNNFRVYSDVLTQPGLLTMRFGSTRINVIDGTQLNNPVLADKKVTIYKQVSEQQRYYWASIHTNSQGQLKVDLPGIDNGQHYILRAKSPVSGQNKYSEPLTHAGDHQFMVGSSPLNVSLVDGLSGAAIAAQRVDVYRLDSNNERDWYTRGETDDLGKVSFDLEGLGASHRYVLKTKVFNDRSSYSAPVSSAGELTFKVGVTAINVTNATVSPAQPLAERKVYFHQQMADGSREYLTSVYSDSNGFVRIDLPQFDSSKLYWVKAKSPTDNSTYYEQAVATQGITQLTVGSTPLTVALTDAINGDVLVDKSIAAYEILASGERKYFKKLSTDNNGMAQFDLPGMDMDGGRQYQLTVRGFGDYKSYSDVITTAGQFNFRVGTASVQLINGSDIAKSPLPDTKLSVMTVQGDKNVWFASATSDENGRVRLDLPGISAGTVYRFKAASPINGSSKYSGLMTQAGNINFVVGNLGTEVTLSNMLNGMSYPNEQVKAYRINAAGEREWYAQMDTDANGVAIFDLDGIGQGQSYQFRARQFATGSSYSHIVSAPGEVDFAIGAVPVTLIDRTTNQPLAGVKITAYDIQDNGKLKWIKSGETDSSGLLVFDLDGLGQGERFAFKAHNPFGDDKRYYGPVITDIGAVTFSIEEGEYGELDLTAPDVVIETPEQNIANANGFRVTGVASDNQAVDYVEVTVVDSLLGTHKVDASFDENNQRWQADIMADWVSTSQTITVIATAYDYALNQGSTSRTYLVSEDIAPPLITITSHQAQDSVNAIGFTVLGTVTDDIGVASITATLSDPLLGETISNQPLSIGMQSGQWALPVTNGKVSSNQMVTITLLATDENGKTSQETLLLNSLQISTNPVQLVQRITFGLTPELLVRLKQGDDILAEQLAPDSIDDSVFEAEMAAAAMNIVEEEDLKAYLVFYMTHSKKQLREVMAWFWENHFNTNLNTHDSLQYELRENNLFRQHALGKFRDLLSSSAKSPAMIHYLNNAQNVAGRANENYAREVMELHTMGVNGGYTATDIAELSRIFTGWHELDGTFSFNDELHDNDDKVFLGQQVIGAGVAEGEQVLDILSSHPSTARFICGKLVTLFVSDQPVNTLQEQCAAEFLASDGDIVAVLSVIFGSEPFAATENYRSKVKTPLELVLSTARGFAAQVDPYGMNDALSEMGMSLFEFPAPTGFSEVSEDWLNSNAILQRMRLVNQAAWQDSDALEVDFRQLLLNQGYHSAEAVVSFLYELALSNDFTELEYQMALDILNQDETFDINGNNADDKLSRLLGTVLSFPGYQYQ